MSILYCVVSQGPVVLARYASCAGNFQEVADQILEQIDVNVSQPRMTYTHAKYLTHYLISQGVIFLCITDDSFDRYRSFLFLEDIKERFQVLVAGSHPREPAPYIWNENFAEVMSACMEYHNTCPPDLDNVTAMRSTVEDVKQTLSRNIEELVNRGERLELLVDKTNRLETGSVTFRAQSQRVQRRAWWNNFRVWIYLAITLTIAIYVLGAAICGWSWQNCGSK